MERKYFIKPNYKSNLIINTFDSKDKIYWTKERISQSYYTRYYLYKFCKKLVKKQKLKSVLDIGCGSALNLMKFIQPECDEVFGIDQEKVINYCKKRYGLKTFISDNIENSSLNLDKKFDLILSFDVIEHLLDPNKLISYIKKYSHENTLIIITTPERDILRGKNCNYSPKNTHVREWNTIEFKKYLRSQNFEILAHIIGENFRIFLNFKNPISVLKSDVVTQLIKMNKFNSLKKIRHCQMVLCKLQNSSDYLKEDSIVLEYEKIGKNRFRDIFKILTIKLYNIFFIFYLILNKKKY